MPSLNLSCFYSQSLIYYIKKGLDTIPMKINILLYLIASLIFVNYQSIADSPFGKNLQKKYQTMSFNDQTIVIIYLTDKGDIKKYKNVQANMFITDRSIKRRLKTRQPDNIINECDYPLNKLYVSLIEKNVIKIRHQLKWFNAVTALVTKNQIEKISKYPFVKEIELVGRWKKNKDLETENPLKNDFEIPQIKSTTTYDYGTSYTQVNLINVPIVHDKGIYGQGVIVGVFDNGFRILNHESFANMNIIAQWDFVDHKESVIPYNPSHGGHGVNTLSTIGGFKSGQLIGPAFGADFILARTENDSSETPIEEDNWAAAIEWADSIGVDVTSTSLGYLSYDPPYTSWTWEDMDGNTTLITRAADHAVGLGIVVVNSAGNSDDNEEHNTLGAPADGDSVITAGAVNSSGVRASFSSVGPTTDIPPRIKPDVMAMGQGVKVASSSNPTGYGTASGTSFSCPLSAGVAALILCANPVLTPIEVREAMRQTASNAAAPDNLMGWGILNADSAIGYYGILPMGKISGNVFADQNSNGIKDPDDTLLTNIKIKIAGPMTDSTYSDSEGNYLFDSLAIGEYILTLEIPQGWKSTTPSTYNINLLHMMDTSGFDFGIFKLATVSGLKFYDINNNGSQDGLEYGLENWVFTLSNGERSYRAVSQPGGIFTFTDIDTGSYFLSESIQVGWFQSIPNNFGSYPISIQKSIDTSGFIFGNFYVPDSTYRISEGWNLLSFPKLVTDYSINKYYPTAISDLFIYHNSYMPLDTIPIKSGYWLKSSATQNMIIQGAPRLVDTLELITGWNLIGTIDDTIPKISIEQSPDTIIGGIFGLSEGTYKEPDSVLYPHQGYWVKAKTDGYIVLNASWKNKNLYNQSNNLKFTPTNSLTFINKKGFKQKLYFSCDSRSEISAGYYELPPLPPDGVFDVRFNNNCLLMKMDSSISTKKILIHSEEYPVTMKWKTQEKGVYLTINERIHNLIDENIFIIEKPSEIYLTLTIDNPVELPMTYTLEQNFPNPFNPTTTIRYLLPSDGWVSLKIFNIFGQEINTLVNEYKNAGYHYIDWDATQFASGVYFYRLNSATFTETKKMVLMR